jgi:DNA-binding CsgD family transcriptional regulator
MAHYISKLTEREREVLRLLSRGYDIKSAAIELSISTSAVTDRLRQARRKLAVSSSREAARVFVAQDSTSTFDVHRFSGMPKPSVLPQLARPGTFARNGIAMTTLIAAAAFISIIAADHSTSNSDGARPTPVDCRAFASAHARNGTPQGRSSGNVHFDTSVKDKRTASQTANAPKKKAEFCIAY